MKQRPSLTVTERLVIRWLAAGLTHEEIGRRIGRRRGRAVSRHTVSNHRQNIARKLGYRGNVIGLIRAAQRVERREERTA